MRKRFQKGSLQKVNGAWVARWRQDGQRKAETLGRISKMSKTQAQSELVALVEPVNAMRSGPSDEHRFRDFVESVFLPFYRRKWKRSTAGTNEDRFACHRTSEFGARPLGSFAVDELQDFLDRKAAAGLSFSVVAHLRWDLRQIFNMAVVRGYLKRNPAALLFIPRECKRASTEIMNTEQVRLLLFAVDTRERLIAGLAILGGMRPGEIFGLKWGRLEAEYADIRQRVYRGDVDSPKSARSTRWAALPARLLASVDEWRSFSRDTSPEAWVFPSENLSTPMSKDNCWRRNFLPKLKPVGLDWANFQVMRRTHSSLLKGLDVDVHIRADQMGHAADINENVYSKVEFAKRKEAVNLLEKSLVDSNGLNVVCK
jgi:integrase